MLNVVRAHDSTAMCLDRQEWEYACNDLRCVPCRESTLNLSGMVKVYGIAAVGQKGLLMCPFVDEAAREEAYTTLGGVVEPKAINLGLMTKTDKGKIYGPNLKQH